MYPKTMYRLNGLMAESVVVNDDDEFDAAVAGGCVESPEELTPAADPVNPEGGE